MTSILTNVAAMSALQTLRSIASGMEETQARVSSGLRVGVAADNAAYWSIATTMRSDNMALGAVSDAIGLGAAKADTAYSGMDAAIDVVKEIKNKIVAAQEPGVDKKKIQEEVVQLQNQLKSIAESASFSGENWLQGDISTAGAVAAVTKSIVGSFTRDANGNVAVKTISYSLNDKSVLFDTDATATAAQKQGILDKQHSITVGTSIDLTINTNGSEQVKTVATYSLDQILSGPGTRTWDEGAVLVAGVTGVPDGDYIKLDTGDWVKAIKSAAAPTNGQEIAYKTATNWYQVDGANAPATTTVTYSVATLDVSAGANLGQMLSVVDKALGMMTSAAAQLGSINMRLDLQGEFVNKLSDALDSGIGRLVDADMNEESTRLKALQTQQQLAIQSLSIANNDSQSVLSLFR